MDLSAERQSFYEVVSLDKLRENEVPGPSSLSFLNILLNTIQQKIEYCQKSVSFIFFATLKLIFLF